MNSKKNVDPAVVVEVKRDLVSLFDDLEISTFIPDEILHNFGPIAKKLGVHEVAMLPMILATAATSMSKAHILVNETWLSSTGIYAVLIGNKGSGKTGIFKYFKKCLAVVEKERFETANRSDDADTTPSKRRKSENSGFDLKHQIILETATKEGLLQVLSLNGGVGCLLSDEYRTVLESMKSYGNDGGAEFMSRFVQMFDGDQIRSNTKGDGLLMVEEPHLSIAGCTQVNTLLNYFKNMTDTQGYWDRHRFFFAPDVYTTYREKQATTVGNVINYTDVLRVLFEVHSTEQTYKISPAADYLIANQHDALQFDRENLQFELDGDDRVGQRAKAFGVLVRVGAVYQAIENAINFLNNGTENLDRAQQDPPEATLNRPGPSRKDTEFHDELYDSQAGDRDSEDEEDGHISDTGSHGDGNHSQPDKYAGWDFNISERNLKMAQELCNVSTLTFEVMKKATSTELPHTSVVSESAIIDLDEPSDKQNEFVKQNYKAFAALHSSKKNENNETTVRQMLKGAKYHPVGKGKDNKEEYIKYIKLLHSLGLVVFNVTTKGQRTEQKIKILTADEREEDANTLVDEIEIIFKAKNPNEPSPFV